MLLGKYNEKCEECTMQFMVEHCNYNHVVNCENDYLRAVQDGQSQQNLNDLKNKLESSILQFYQKRYMYEDEWDEYCEETAKYCPKCVRVFKNNCVRGNIWKVLLRIKQIDMNHYLTLVRKGSHAEDYERLLSDLDRTLGYFPVGFTIYKSTYLLST